ASRIVPVAAANLNRRPEPKDCRPAQAAITLRAHRRSPASVLNLLAVVVAVSPLFTYSLACHLLFSSLRKATTWRAPCVIVSCNMGQAPAFHLTSQLHSVYNSVASRRVKAILEFFSHV